MRRTCGLVGVILLILVFFLAPDVAFATSTVGMETALAVERSVDLKGIEGVAIGVAVLAFAVLLVSKHLRRNRAGRELIRQEKIFKAFANACDDGVFLKDHNARYVFTNPAFKRMVESAENNLLDFENQELVRGSPAWLGEEAKGEVLGKIETVRREVMWNDKAYDVLEFPVPMPNGKTGVGSIIRDSSRQASDNKNSEKPGYRYDSLVAALMSEADNLKDEVDRGLKEALELTASQYGLVYLYDEKNDELTLNALFISEPDNIKLKNIERVFRLNDAGLWGETVRQRKPMIRNDRVMPSPSEREGAFGEAVPTRFLSYPIILDGRVEAVLGLANKQEPYDQKDIDLIALLTHNVWNRMKRREVQQMITSERAKYYRTLLSIGGAVIAVDPCGRVENMNVAAQNMTGWELREAAGQHYAKVFPLRYPTEPGKQVDPVAKAMEEGAFRDMSGDAVLDARNGKEYSIEFSAVPLVGEEDRSTGALLIFRDITALKRGREQIEYLSYHDPLTGLYNRGYMNMELKRLDCEENLPLTILMADLNGLKLANDVFGHAEGDRVIKGAGDMLRQHSRLGDVLGRWGGDEFLLIMKRTGVDEAAALIRCIDEQCGTANTGPIRCSISIGTATKQQMKTPLTETLRHAEIEMYNRKTLRRVQDQKERIEEILTQLHTKSVREREHAEAVRQLCKRVGIRMQLSAGEVCDLKRAAYLHDIGKIALDEQLLNVNHGLSELEEMEIRRHPSVGYRLLSAFDETLSLASIVLAHHEQWDGNGYPRGLKGDEIPIASRIIAAAEVFDRLVHDADNRKAITKEQAVQVLRKLAGAQLDPDVVEAMEQVLAEEGMLASEW